jgi:Kdo2-lipid IVA lauroyltransferase/acyltransferase
MFEIKSVIFAPDRLNRMAKKRPFRKRVKYFLLYFLVKSLIFIASVLPRKAVLRFCGMLGGLAFHLVGAARTKTLRNLEKVYGASKTPEEIRKMAKRVFVMIGKNAGEIIRAVSINDIERFKKLVHVHNEDRLYEAISKGKGVIILTAHLGAFELVGTYMALMNFKPLIIGTAQKDKRLNQLLVENRNKMGTVVIERGKDTLKLMRNLNSGGMMLILIDQDTKVKSVFVDFMGKPAATPIGAALFALRTEAVVLPVGIHMDENLQQHITILPEVPLVKTGNEEEDILVNTRNYSAATEELISLDPTQWVWMHERWKTQPEK